MDIDLNTLRSVITLLSFACFMAIVASVYLRRNRRGFDDAANLPFADDDATTPLDSNGGHRE